MDRSLVGDVMADHRRRGKAGGGVCCPIHGMRFEGWWSIEESDTWIMSGYVSREGLHGVSDEERASWRIRRLRLMGRHALAALINSRDLSLNVLLRAHIRNDIVYFTTITELVKQVYQILYKQF